MNKVEELLSRRVKKVLPSKQGLKKLLTQKKIRLYQGFDATGSRLHLGHTVGLRKLMEFANAGHEVIFLFGTGTVLVGDPSQRASGRKLITPKEVAQNIKSWKKQVAPIIDFNKITIKKNGDWLTKLTLTDIIAIASKISAIQLFKRDSFKRRLKHGDTVWYHETMYPLLQGYDSVVMDVDLEIGGTDQEFNMLIGRELLRKMKHKEKFVLTLPLIPGTDGQPMSKTTGNCIWLDDSAQNMFGKIMRIQDQLISQYFEFFTNLPMTQVKQIKQSLKSGKAHPMEAKKQLAFSITADFHGQAQAQAAQSHFETTVQKKQTPKNLPTFKLSSLPKTATIVDLLEKSKLVKSRGDAKRLIEQQAVSINNIKCQTSNVKCDQLKASDIIKVGKRRWLKVT